MTADSTNRYAGKPYDDSSIKRAFFALVCFWLIIQILVGVGLIVVKILYFSDFLVFVALPVISLILSVVHWMWIYHGNSECVFLGVRVVRAYEPIRWQIAGVILSLIFGIILSMLALASTYFVADRLSGMPFQMDGEITGTRTGTERVTICQKAILLRSKEGKKYKLCVSYRRFYGRDNLFSVDDLRVGTEIGVFGRQNILGVVIDRVVVR